MLGLPTATEVNRQLPKTLVYKQFGLTTQQRDRFDVDISRMAIVNVVSPDTVPGLATGESVKAFYVLAVSLKRKDYDAKNIAMLAKLIPQHLLFALQYEDEMQLAIFQEKLFVSPWHNTANLPVLSLNGLNLDRAWENIVTTVGSFSIQGENTLKEQIKQDEAKAKLCRQIELLEKRCRLEKQPRRKAELFEELKKLKKQNIMDIQEFIKETIKQITIGTSQANKEIEQYGALLPDTSCSVNRENYQYYNEGGVSRRIVEVNFDIAVTVAQNDDSSIGGGIKVCGLNFGTDKSNCNSNQTSSRVQFKLLLVLPQTNSSKYNG